MQTKLWQIVQPNISDVLTDAILSGSLKEKVRISESSKIQTFHA